MKMLCALACDDVRQELNNKHILIGVYGPKIRVNALPGVIGMAYYFQFEASNDEVGKEITMEVQVIARLNDGSEKKAMSGKFGISFRSEKAALIATPPFAIPMAQEGTVVFQLREQGKRWKTVLSHEVKIDTSLKSAISLLPPS
jgi:hypothetical protein